VPHRRIRVVTLARRLRWSRRRLRRVLALHGLAARTAKTVALDLRLVAVLLAERLAGDLLAS